MPCIGDSRPARNSSNLRREFLDSLHISAIHHYFHKVTFRLVDSLSKEELGWLRKHCRHAHQRVGHPIPGLPTYRWLLVTVAPDKEAIGKLAERNAIFINHAEIARDIITATQDEAERLREIHRDHFIQPHNRKRTTLEFENGDETGRRTRGTRFAWYADRPSDLTGEVPCFHMEARIQGKAACEQKGISHPQDLLDFDHASFWEKHLNLYEIDVEKLGRLHLNRMIGRHEPVHVCRNGFKYHVDRRTGGTMFRSLSMTARGNSTLQTFMGRYGGGIDRFLRKIDTNLLMDKAWGDCAYRQ